MNTSVVSPGRAGLILLLTGQMLPLIDTSITNVALDAITPRRESLDPQRLGLPRSGRRRTPGLRREEVALLADVGVTWYTWLEQGRDVNPQSKTLWIKALTPGA